MLRIRSDLGAIFQRLIPLHINVAFLVSLLLVIVGGSLVFYDQIQGRRIALAEANTSFQRTGEVIGVEVRSILEPIETAVETLTATIPLLPDDAILSIETVRLFANRIAETPFLYALEYGNEEGDFVLVFNLDESDPGRVTPESYLAWVIDRSSSGAFKQTVYTLDSDLNVLTRDDRFNNGYDPRTRPWYYSALRSADAIQTAPYVYAETLDIGVTIARSLPDKRGVIGGDLTLGALSRALSSSQSAVGGNAVVFDDTGQILAADDAGLVAFIERSEDRPIIQQQTLSSVGRSEFRAVGQLFTSGTRTGIAEVEIEGRDWIVWLAPLELGSKASSGAHIALLAPAADVYEQISSNMEISLIIALIGLLLGLLAAWRLGTAIAGPIQSITKEALLIREFDLSDRGWPSSKVAEVYRLSEAIAALKGSLKDFARYVPNQLVKLLVTGEVKAVIGGERREISMIFTDIEGFTTISESKEPMQLMNEVSEYLALISRVFIEHGGTIDKFIGDAAMVIWNAPALQVDHVDMACRAALSAEKSLASFNATRIGEGLEPFHTRFGVHVGDAVVGNVGSRERMNYTALGANVNLAARLEGLNKTFGTKVLISDSIVEKATANLVTRPIDSVIPKGTTIPVHVFELIGIEEDGYEPTTNEREMISSWNIAFDIFATRAWASAVSAFQAHCDRFPDDRAAQVLLRRAEDFVKHPPPDDWDGVKVAETK